MCPLQLNQKSFWEITDELRELVESPLIKIFLRIFSETVPPQYEWAWVYLSTDLRQILHTLKPNPLRNTKELP